MNEIEYYKVIDEYKERKIDHEEFEKKIEIITDNLSSPQKEFYRIYCYLQNHLYVPKNKRDYLFDNVLPILTDKTINNNQKEIIKCALMIAYEGNYDYEKAEDCANDLLKSSMNQNILLEVANYYIKTRRYTLASEIYARLLKNSNDEIIANYEKFKGIMSGRNKPYMPLDYENQIKYVNFLKKLDIEVKLRKRSKQPQKIAKDQYPLPREITTVNFKNFVAFDIETTGKNPNEDSITEIGAIKVVDGKVIESKEFTFQELVYPYKKKISESVELLTGITNDMVYDAREIWDVFKDFTDFIGNDILVGYNCMTFDSKFLVRAGRLSNVIIYNEYFDVMHYVAKFKSKLNYKDKKLNTIAQQLEIINKDAHRALSDAITTAKVFLKLLELEEKEINIKHLN